MIRIELKHVIFKRQVLIRKGVSLKDISDATGISRATLHRMIKDPSYNACLEHLGKICDYLNCDISELLIYEPDPV